MFAGFFFAQNTFGDFVYFRVLPIVGGGNNIIVDFTQFLPVGELAGEVPSIAFENTSTAVGVGISSPFNIIYPNATYSSPNITYSSPVVTYSGKITIPGIITDAPVVSLENPDLAISFSEIQAPSPKPARVKYSSSTTRYSDIGTTYSGQ